MYYISHFDISSYDASDRTSCDFSRLWKQNTLTVLG